MDRIRRVAFMFERAVTANATSHIYLRDVHKPATPPPGAKSQLTFNGEPTDALQVGSFFLFFFILAPRRGALFFYLTLALLFISNVTIQSLLYE